RHLDELEFVLGEKRRPAPLGEPHPEHQPRRVAIVGVRDDDSTDHTEVADARRPLAVWRFLRLRELHHVADVELGRQRLRHPPLRSLHCHRCLLAREVTAIVQEASRYCQEASCTFATAPPRALLAARRPSDTTRASMPSRKRPSKQVLDAARELVRSWGSQGGKIGGKARWAGVPPEERSRILRKAAQARRKRKTK